MWPRDIWLYKILPQLLDKEAARLGRCCRDLREIVGRYFEKHGHLRLEIEDGIDAAALLLWSSLKALSTLDVRLEIAVNRVDLSQCTNLERIHLVVNLPQRHCSSYGNRYATLVLPVREPLECVINTTRTQFPNLRVRMGRRVAEEDKTGQREWAKSRDSGEAI
jgi:hypothetical protein